MTENTTTPFEEDFNGWLNGTKRFPTVSHVGDGETKEIPFVLYAITVHLSQLKMMRSGLKFRGIKLQDFKKYYGLQGKDCRLCYTELERIKQDVWELLELN
jgi:hypothetical protein